MITASSKILPACRHCGNEVLHLITHLEATLEDLLSLGPADGAVDGDLLVTPDAEAAHRVARLGEHRRLTGQLLQHLGGAGQPGNRGKWRHWSAWKHRQLAGQLLQHPSEINSITFASSVKGKHSDCKVCTR